MSSKQDIPSTVAVLDIEKHGGRRIADTVTGCGLQPLLCRNLEHFTELLEERFALIGMVAFESLWPDPQKTLRRLRERAGASRLAVIYSEGAPRWRLGQRLWSIGLFDYFTPRSTPPHEMRPVLRQAWADALADASLIREPGTTSALDEPLRTISSLGAAFAGQQQVEGLLRELQTRLPQLLDYNLLEVLVVRDEAEAPQIFVSQTRPVDHETIWDLASQLCSAITPLRPEVVGPGDLTWEGAAPIRPSSTSKSPSGEVISMTFPMVIGGDLVGCMGLQLPETTASATEAQLMLQVLAVQLGTALRNAQMLEELESQSLVDELTGAYNRRFLKRFLGSEWKRSERYHLELSIALLDIDDFTKINDEYGFVAGDQVLRGLTQLLTSQLREVDRVVRYGGEEFVVLLPQTGASEAVLVIDRIRKVVADSVLYEDPRKGPVKTTFSAGVAAYPTAASSSAEHLLEFADEALYRAKRAGRNQVVVSSGRAEAMQSTALGAPAADDAMIAADERRSSPRVGADLRVRFIPLPGVDGQMIDLDTVDVGAGGIAVRGPAHELKLNTLALVYLGEKDQPSLCRVVWTRRTDAGEHLAGLHYVSGREVASGAPLNRERQRALVICDLAKTRAQVQRVLRAAQCESVIVDEDDSPLLDAENLANYSLFVVGQSRLRGSVGKKLRNVPRDPSARIVVINEGGDRREALGAIHEERLEHLVPSPVAEEALFATLNKLLLGEYFGIKKYLLWGAVTRSWRLENSEEKAKVLDGIVDMAREVKCHPRIIDLLVQAVDEMIINALFRTKTAEDKRRPVTVDCGSDGRLLAVSVIDEHGLLDSGDLFAGVAAALESERDGIPDGATHAHLGFRIMLDALSQLSVNVDPGRCTEIIGIVDLRRSLREHRAAVPGLGVFRAAD